MIDDVAPQFRSMLEESYSCSKLQVDDDISRTMYWVQKAKLNKRLENFTRFVLIVSCNYSLTPIQLMNMY